MHSATVERVVCLAQAVPIECPAIQPRIVLARDALHQGGTFIPREISDELFHKRAAIRAPSSSPLSSARTLDNCEIQDLFPLPPRKRSENAVSRIEVPGSFRNSSNCHFFVME
jgi:hypothetical protein